MKSILITGADGFIGKSLISQLIPKDYTLTLAVRDIPDESEKNENVHFVNLHLEKLISETDRPSFKNIDIVVHLAGLAHDEGKEQLHLVNTEGTRRLAEIAQENGAELFIFISTAKVHGDESDVEINETSPIQPKDSYSLSKLGAEKALIEVCQKGKMQYVVLRPPLIFGPGVKANFYELLGMIYKNYPMPFSKFNNVRSYMYVENLCHIIEGIIHNPECKNRIYLVKDYDVSIEDLIIHIARAFGHKAKLFKMPSSILDMLASLINKKTALLRLRDKFTINNNKILNDLGWISSVDFDTALGKTVEWYIHHRK